MNDTFSTARELLLVAILAQTKTLDITHSERTVAASERLFVSFLAHFSLPDR